MDRYVCIHGHFYQPPRENPWLEEIELQDAAYPYHDWNEKINEECYSRNTASRILNSEKKIIDIINNYAKISFNFGPTFFTWAEKHAPETYRAIVAADKESVGKFSGHGSAIAQVYNHMIMPLANSRDKQTQVIWGIKDFEHRFGRKPEGMWLSETAVDLETLDILSEHGIKFTILAPHQARRVRKIGDKSWKDVGGKIDPKMPYLCKLPTGKTISLFFYDGPIAHDVAFGELLKSGESFAKRLIGAFSDKEQPQIVHIATDGETYGHHHRFTDMALAYCLYFLESNKLAKITVYGEYLEKYPPTHEVEIIENSSWSCSHGIERWKSDCGCNTGMHNGWNQKWRAPLRGAMDWLRDALVGVYEKEMQHYLKDPWEARNDYISIVLDRSLENVERYLSNHAVEELTQEDKVRVLKLLEMQRHAMLMYTSCGWFFDEISGIETVQTMRYAARAMQIARELTGANLEPEYIKILNGAPSNIKEYGNGAAIYEKFVLTSIVNLYWVVAHYAISSLFEKYPEALKIYCYTIKSEFRDFIEFGRQKLAIGKVRVHSDSTWEESDLSFAVLYFGDNNLVGGAREYMGDDQFSRMNQEIKGAFGGDITEVIQLMDNHFGTHNYSLRHLFVDEQRKILTQIQEPKLKELEIILRRLYEDNYPLAQVMRELRMPLSKAITALMEFVINQDIRKLLESEKMDLDRLRNLIEGVKRESFELDKATLGFVASQKINAIINEFSQKPEDESLLEAVGVILEILSGLDLGMDLWKAQNVFFFIGKQFYDSMKERSEKGDEIKKKWIEHFDKVENYLQVKVK